MKPTAMVKETVADGSGEKKKAPSSSPTNRHVVQRSRMLFSRQSRQDLRVPAVGCRDTRRSIPQSRQFGRLRWSCHHPSPLFLCNRRELGRWYESGECSCRGEGAGDAQLTSSRAGWSARDVPRTIGSRTHTVRQPGRRRQVARPSDREAGRARPGAAHATPVRRS